MVSFLDDVRLASNPHELCSDPVDQIALASKQLATVTKWQSRIW